jgi:hypothetical protein
VKSGYQFSKHVQRGIVERDGIAITFGHFALAIEVNQQWHRDHALLALPDILLRRSADKQMKQLVTATELDIGAWLDGILSLQQWVNKFDDGDWHTFRAEFGKIIALEHASNCDPAREISSILKVYFPKPLTIAVNGRLPQFQYVNA